MVLSGLCQDLKNVRVTAGDLKSDTGAGVFPAQNISVNFVGYVHTMSTDAYSSEWAGLWPDPLLTVKSVDVPVGKVQPIWVTFYAPAGTRVGKYTGKLTITADGIEPQRVTLKARIFDFDLPLRGAFQAMTIDGGPHGNFYGLGEGRRARQDSNDVFRVPLPASASAWRLRAEVLEREQTVLPGDAATQRHMGFQRGREAGAIPLRPRDEHLRHGDVR